MAEFSPDARPGQPRGHGRHRTSHRGPRARGAAPGSWQALRPAAGWADEDLETTPLPPGEWWVVDAVEGAVNYVHGMPEWARDGDLAARRPAGARPWCASRSATCTYTAVRGRGRVPERAAAARLGQDRPGRRHRRHRPGRGGPGRHLPADRRVGHRHAEPGAAGPGVVPSTFPMLLVAAGHTDVFWQYEPVLPGVAAGALLITEAGGTVSRIDGSPWGPAAPTSSPPPPACTRRPRAPWPQPPDRSPGHRRTSPCSSPFWPPQAAPGGN